MKILNLTNLDTSDIKFKVSKFPDGQQNIVIKGFWVHHQETRTHSEESELHKVGSTIFNMHLGNCIKIKSRLNNWLDLELIVASVASLRELGVEEIHLYVPYIMGARSDRKFEEGGNNYLRDVLCPIINSLNFKTVTCIDPHSDVLEACIKNFVKESNKQLLGFTVKNIYGPPIDPSGQLHKNTILVSPDAGASKKIYKLAEQIGYKGDIITCSKDRDENGKLTRTVVPYHDIDYRNKDFIIIDDICDGGATFINIAKQLHSGDFTDENGKMKHKIYLIVTHGIFSKGFEELSQYFDGIYCTNSYSTIFEHHDKTRYWPVKDFCKQLNVF